MDARRARVSKGRRTRTTAATAATFAAADIGRLTCAQRLFFLSAVAACWKMPRARAPS